LSAARLQVDWYFRYADYEPAGDGGMIMSYGESNAALAFELVRWLGPDAELLSPIAWRDQLRTELLAMAEKLSSSASAEPGFP